MSVALRRRLASARPEGDAGMTLAELTIVIAISSVVLAMAFTVVASFAKTDARNLARQSRVDEVRQVALWLGDALAYAHAPETTASGAVVPEFEEARSQSMVFTSALGGGPGSPDGSLSRVSVVLNKNCLGHSDPGVLHRCVEHTYTTSGGSEEYCSAGASCPDPGLFKDTVMARGVKDQGLFQYSVTGQGTMNQVIDPALRAKISAVEFKVTVAAPAGSADSAAESTVVKRYSINEWRNW
jgi:prepilin-type N-terminal cleavage/methylation domain-containing protein